MIKSCYIHIPFCEKICSYCDFCKMYYNEQLVDSYLDSLEKEISSIYNNEVLDTIYIGGGTPSCLNNKQLERLLNIVKNLKLNNNYEYTIEGNFENTTKEKLDLYKKYGINRLSFGIESTNTNNLKVLNRTLNKKQVEDIISYSKEIGIDNINVDLIYALENENIDILEEDINYILSLEVKHISTYSLIIEDNTMLSINKYKNIDEDLDYEMYKYICNRLKDNNYIHYEISNFSKEGYESKHNSCYWKNEEYYGFGLGASSYIANKRITNTRSINNYLKGNVIKEIEELSMKDKIEYEIILNLRLNTGINLNNFYNKYKIPFQDIYQYKPLLEQKYLIELNNNLFIPENKWYISNEIIMKLLGSEVNE